MYWPCILQLFLADSVFNFFFCIQDCASVNINTFASFQIWIPFIWFSCLSALASTSSIIINRSGKSGHLFLVPDFMGKVLGLSSLNMMLTVGFSWMLQVEEISIYSYFIECFLSKKNTELCQMLLYLLRLSCSFCPLFSWYVVLHWLIFLYIEQTLHSWNNPTCLCYINHFLCCWIWFASILFSTFTSIFIKILVCSFFYLFMVCYQGNIGLKICLELSNCS